MTFYLLDLKKAGFTAKPDVSGVDEVRNMPHIVV